MQRPSVRRRPHVATLARRAAAAAIVPLALAGCRFGGRSAEPTATVRVENNLVPSVALTISLIPQQGERRTIGVVPAGSTEELRFPVRGGADPHRLLAEPATGPGAVSRQFTLASSSRLDWNVGRNVLNVSETR